MLSPKVEKESLTTLKVILIVLHDHDADCSRVAIIGDARILSNIIHLLLFLASKIFVVFV